MKSNFFHKTWRCGLIKITKRYDWDESCIYRLTHSFNVMRRFSLGFDIDISSFAMNWSVSFIVFNWNGMVIYGKM